MEATALHIAGSQRVFALTKSFAIQYASLILIILAVVAGAFAKRPTATAPPLAEESLNIFSAAVLPVATTEYPNFFSEDGKVQDGDALYAIQTMLTEHDLKVDLEVAVAVKNETESEREFSNGIVMARALKQMLQRSGAPADSLRVFLSESKERGSLRALFYKQEPKK